ncbi:MULTISPECIES: DegT/DnrJ/EryC1/StrS family aminotransferase [unclassified Leptolyngbya]|uniref:DegT/DnrJ/EryC1/StrS family aminotransferase n=1 Tax=unclassified Leptolyngbya TaxID=2650499 RepID=UPI0016830DFF|nr:MULTISPECIES: DegT/DnrJ/EryC1/StrS family aminotransferase [unclassified Leptolyngbya]MBD1911969.1 DegT/DnrJ/EryC1/StrS family aminotransferase [Leptolyngbya sp. FACHB-8]MBD2157095.1 DegT/DnrJ/EryC1/StrS family aminotransferase [Leptolyngbya sp. FACHB-16]
MPSIPLPESGNSDLFPPCKIPFLDLKLQHQPILFDLEQSMRQVWQEGKFVPGRDVEDFEATFAYASGCRYGIGVGSGMDAITLGLRACGIGEGDEVLVPAYSFIGTVLGVMATGARPILVDCDAETGLIDLVEAEKAITPRTRAIVPVYLYGQMVSPQRILDLSSTYDLMVFEDAAQAPLAEREGYRAGSVGIAAAFSFYPTLSLGAFGDGGAVVTSDTAISERVHQLRNYGASRQNHYAEVGVSSCLDTLQAAILRVKLPLLPGWNGDRYRLAQNYDRRLQYLQGKGIYPIANRVGTGHVYFRYVIRIAESCRLNRALLQNGLATAGIETRIHYPVPVYRQPAFKLLDYQPEQFPQTELLSQTVLSLPLYPGMQDQQVDTVVEVLESLLSSSFGPSVVWPG